MPGNFKNGAYPDLDPKDYGKVFGDRKVRFGAYGNPSLLPLAKVKAIAEASDATQAVLSLALAVEQNLDIMQDRGTKAPYDGMVEIWWERGNDVVAFLESGSGDKVIDDLRRAQEAFMDLPNSTFFFASEDG